MFGVTHHGRFKHFFEVLVNVLSKEYMWLFGMSFIIRRECMDGSR